MSNTEHKISCLQILSKKLQELKSEEEFLIQVENNNLWFIPDFVKYHIDTICNNLLVKTKLQEWITKYELTQPNQSIGLILAGNIPMVGFHDILCCYMADANIKIKVSSKDEILTKRLIKIWKEIDPIYAPKIEIVDRIDNIDKIIATGSQNSNRYFEYYFRKYKNILRTNRTSMAVIKKDCTDDELKLLCDDIFLFFGLGCRNVGFFMIEKGFDFKQIFENCDKYEFAFNHQKYMNNYDYQRTLLLLNRIEHHCNNYLIIRESDSLFSPISVLNYQYYDSEQEVDEFIETHKDSIQCIVGRNIPYGKSQQPLLSEYADGVDTMSFLNS